MRIENLGGNWVSTMAGALLFSMMIITITITITILLTFLKPTHSGKTTTIFSSTSFSSNNHYNVPALFVIGDSSVDSGTNNFLGTLARADRLPYGRDFDTHRPTGRFSNGRIPVDYLGNLLFSSISSLVLLLVIYLSFFLIFHWPSRFLIMGHFHFLIWVFLNPWFDLVTLVLHQQCVLACLMCPLILAKPALSMIWSMASITLLRVLD